MAQHALMNFAGRLLLVTTEAIIIGLQFMCRLCGVCQQCNTLEDAARNGHLACMRILHSPWEPWPRGLSCLAAREGNLDILQHLQSQQYLWDSLVAAAAATGGHLHCLEYLMGNGAVFDRMVWEGAASGGHLNVLDWLEARGCYGLDSALYAAARFSQLACLAWAMDRSPDALNTSVSASALMSGSLACLQLSFARGCPVPCTYPAWTNDQGCLRWCIRNASCEPAPILQNEAYLEAWAAIFTGDVLQRVYERERNEKAATIQRAWLGCYYAPWHRICQRRLVREYNFLSKLAQESQPYRADCNDTKVLHTSNTGSVLVFHSERLCDCDKVGCNVHG